MKRRKPEEMPAIVVDSNEQAGYTFENCVRYKLADGDYSLVGYEHVASIERKSKSDAYKSVGKERPRFKREVERLAGYEYAAIVIESTLPDFLKPPPFVEKMNARSALSTFLAWSVRYGVHVHFAGDRTHTRALVQRLLQYFWTYHADEEGLGGAPRGGQEEAGSG